MTSTVDNTVRVIQSVAKDPKILRSSRLQRDSIWMTGKSASLLQDDGKEIMLLGEYQHTIDEKGRMAIPAKFRKTLAGGVVVTKGSESCLYLYPLEEWTKLAEKLSKLPINQADARAFSRLMLAGASHAEIDSQGRILVPDYLRNYAGIRGKAIIVGLYNRAEIWDEEKWQQYRRNIESQGDEIAERLGGFGT